METNKTGQGQRWISFIRRSILMRNAFKYNEYVSQSIFMKEKLTFNKEEWQNFTISSEYRLKQCFSEFAPRASSISIPQ